MRKYSFGWWKYSALFCGSNISSFIFYYFYFQEMLLLTLSLQLDQPLSQTDQHLLQTLQIKHIYLNGVIRIRKTNFPYLSQKVCITKMYPTGVLSLDVMTKD